ncbi:hypothetical protein Pint_22443 [Pistacia integerrima]|uniref:Uncharacterized protein n=1 Tax=Pistacia integerrima TaxID=434235 RepID=A0ACC0YG86_9ROSI|nr:hypothetical protein Pint_22443 [Pistacia integerrima]
MPKDTAKEILKNAPGVVVIDERDPITFLRHWRYQTKMMSQLAGFVVMFLKMGISGWISLSAVIKFAKELHLMLFRLPSCYYSQPSSSEVSSNRLLRVVR